MAERSFITIHVAENGQTNSVQADFSLETSQDLLNRLLRNSEASIAEFKTIILMKVIRPTDGFFTWLVKYPPETSLCICTRCRCRSAHDLDNESLWISPTESPALDSPTYLGIQITQQGEIQSVKARNIEFQEFQSLIETPLNLGDLGIGEFQTITLIKLKRSDNAYTWLVKHSFEPSAENKDSASVSYTGVSGLQDDHLWIKP